MQIEDRILAELRQRKPARLLAQGAAAQALARHNQAAHAGGVLVGSNEMAELALALKINALKDSPSRQFQC